SAASAVVSDLIFLGRKVISRDTRPQYHFSNKKLKIIDVKKLKRKFLITFNVKDIYGVLAKITTALATEKVSINSLFQEESPGSGRVVPVRILTHAVEEFKVINALKRLESKDFIISINHIPLFS
ncbi:MAG: ACT domain-containing protein, partial [bacterium]|nr:ACT domain-containing protein [bacterium]